MNASVLARTAQRAATHSSRRALLRAGGWLAATLLAFAAWQGYQNPDLLLNIAQAFRLC